MNASVPAALLRYMDGLKARDLEMIGSSLSESVRFVTPFRTMGKAYDSRFSICALSWFSDWNYDHDQAELLEDGSFAVFWRQGGKHTGTLSFPGFEPIDATGKSVKIPPHHFFYRLGSAGLTEIRPDPIPGGAPRGIFEQIGGVASGFKFQAISARDPFPVKPVFGGVFVVRGKSPTSYFSWPTTWAWWTSSAYQDFTGNAAEVQLHTPQMERLARLGVRFTARAHAVIALHSHPLRSTYRPLSVAQPDEMVGALRRAG